MQALKACPYEYPCDLMIPNISVYGETDLKNQSPLLDFLMASKPEKSSNTKANNRIKQTLKKAEPAAVQLASAVNKRKVTRKALAKKPPKAKGKQLEEAV
jgi:hypothetical protein